MANNSKSIDGRSKGKRFERKVVTLLSDYWGVEAKRTPGSGNYHASSGFSNLQGDVVLEEGSGFPFITECKHHDAKAWTIENLLLNTGDIKDWYSQVITDCRRVKTSDPLLIFTRNYAKEFVMLPYKNSLFVSLAEGNHPVMASVVTYKHEVTEKEESFLTLTTTWEGFSSMPKQYYMDNYGSKHWNWEAETMINTGTQEDTSIREKANDILNLMFGED